MSSLGAVVLHRNAMDRPGAQRARGVADGDVEMVPAAQVLGGRKPRGGIEVDAIERQHQMEPPLDRPIEEAGGIG